MIQPLIGSRNQGFILEMPQQQDLVSETLPPQKNSRKNEKDEVFVLRTEFSMWIFLWLHLPAALCLSVGCRGSSSVVTVGLSDPVTAAVPPLFLSPTSPTH